MSAAGVVWAMCVTGALAWFVLSGFGCAAARKGSECGVQSKPADDLAVSVMTFNIRYGAAQDGKNRWALRRELVYDVIRRHRPDIACLQEALHWQLHEVLLALPAYGYVGVGRDDGKRDGEFAPILYRADRFDVADQGTFWLSDTPETPGSMTWGNRLPRICTWARLVDRAAGHSMHVYNLHLDHESQPSRERAVELLARRIDVQSKGAPLIVAGDFNAGEDNPAIRFLTGEAGAIVSAAPRRRPSSGLVDTFRVLHPDAANVGTYHRFDGTMSGSKVDYIFVPPSARVRSAEIVHNRQNERYPSDHFPVTADLVFDVR
jgi:endonuclease/exonuclease/phosphatase family metal-dependent hydrolase